MTLDELPLDSIALARFLLGAILVNDVSDAPEGRRSMRIVETEAYLPGDPAAHAYRRETTRNRSLFKRHGHAYVYFIYGMHFCINISSEKAGVGGGVLIRAGEPLAGIPLMQERRPRAAIVDLCRGPGKLATCLGIDRSHDGLDLVGGEAIWLAAGEPPPQVRTSVRIGITKAVDLPLRFFEAGSPFVSGPKSLNAATLRATGPGHP